jgi:hypothetical protein
MIPGFFSAQNGASGSKWAPMGAQITTQAASTLLYSTNEDKYFQYDYKGNEILYANPDSVFNDSTGWTIGAVTSGQVNLLVSRPSYENGWAFIPNANNTVGSGVIHYTNNITTGTMTTTTILNNSPRFVIWQSAANRWLAGGGDGSWATATGSYSEGLTWTLRTASGTQTHIAAATDGTNVLAIGAASTMRLFGTGTTGSAETNTGLFGSYGDIAYANGTWVVVGSSGLCGYKTTLGSSWTIKDIGFGTGNIYGICFYNNRWYASGRDSNNNTYIVVKRSSDQNITSNWTDIYTTTSTVTPGWVRPANNKFVSFNDGDTVIGSR